jgi:hypothetical protein
LNADVELALYEFVLSYTRELYICGSCMIRRREA